MSYTKPEHADAAITHMNGYFIGQKRLKVVRKRGQQAERCPPSDNTPHSTCGGGGRGCPSATTDDPGYAPNSDSSVLGGMMGRPGNADIDVGIELAPDNFGSDVISNKDGGGGGSGGSGSGVGGSGNNHSPPGGGLQLELDFLTPESLLGQSMAR